MRRKHLIAIFGVLLILTSLALEAKSQIRQSGNSSAEPCPDKKVYFGEYRNRRYGFSIVIPAGRKGYWNSGRCAPDEKHGCICLGSDHGRIIPLSDVAHIEVFTGYQMESEWSVRDYERDSIFYAKNRQKLEQVKLLSSKSVRLGTLKARRFSLQFIDKDKNVIIDQVITLHKGVEYRLILITLVDRYQKDKREFEKVIASWRLAPRME